MPVSNEDYKLFWAEINRLVQDGFRVHEGGLTRYGQSWCDLVGEVHGKELWWSLSVGPDGYRRIDTTDPDNPEDYTP